jgi:hypothetical protein
VSRSRPVASYVFLGLLTVLVSGFASWSILFFWERYHQSYDSGWIAVDNKVNRDLRIPHGLGHAPTQITVWFSPTSTADVVYPVTWPWAANLSGNPVQIAVDRDAVTLKIYGGAPLHGVWSSSTGVWTPYASGFFRITAR